MTRRFGCRSTYRSSTAKARAAGRPCLRRRLGLSAPRTTSVSFDATPLARCLVLHPPTKQRRAASLHRRHVHGHAVRPADSCGARIRADEGPGCTHALQTRHASRRTIYRASGEASSKRGTLAGGQYIARVERRRETPRWCGRGALRCSRLRRHGRPPHAPMACRREHRCPAPQVTAATAATAGCTAHLHARPSARSHVGCFLAFCLVLNAAGVCDPTLLEL